MQTVLTLEMVFSLILSVVFGLIVGMEREYNHRPAGLHTHMLVSLGSCLFTIVSISFDTTPTQIASGIVAGIGFIGAGTIWAERDKIQGITTAASLWATAAIGLTVGIGDYLLAATVTVLVLIILVSKYFFSKIGFERHQIESK
jgi:putative Mg2+ transporter-C (MgtC) family protein